MSTYIPRPEYPRPDFERTEWLNLNGEWEFEFDDQNMGEKEGWHTGKDFSRRILVPFCYQSELSGVHDIGLHPVFWYKKSLSLPESFKGKKVLLHFGAVDYFAKIWINGVFAGSHKGGHVPFKMEIARLLKDGPNTIVLRVEDGLETVQPRGKQYWKYKPDRCWYTATSGIWQTVWMETVGEVYFDKIRLTPDIDRRNVLAEVFLSGEPGEARIDARVSFKGEVVKVLSVSIRERITRFTVDIKEQDDIDEIHYWTPQSPNLYDIEFCLSRKAEALNEVCLNEQQPCQGQSCEELLDRVNSYFGMRKISVKGDMTLLNNRPLYQKLVLDQGYWPQSLLTPPSDDAIRYDIEMTKKMGFNGARKHQKVEDPRYYYWADRLGLLVWGEMPSAYKFNVEETENITKEWTDFINRDYNHPCIVTWVPLNESWGVRNIFADRNQQNFGRMLYFLTKAMDGTRLVSTNDGWEQVDSDICAIHDYIAGGEDFTAKYQDKEKILSGSPASRMLYAEGTRYEGQPILVTEYGGIAFESNEKGNWGYNGAVKDEGSFFARYASITNAIRKMPYIKGYCYTQLTDVMQEVNGLMTVDRKMKVDIEQVKKINT